MGRVTAQRQRDTFAAVGTLADRLTALSALDPTIGADEVAQALRDASRLRVAMAHLLEVLKALPVRVCGQCGAAMNGRTDRLYCGPTCRQRARRAAEAVDQSSM